MFDNGKFVGNFDADVETAKKCTRRARKQNDLLNAKEDFKQAYELYSNIEHEISVFESEGAALESRFVRYLWTAVKIVMSVAISLGVAFLFSN